MSAAKPIALVSSTGGHLTDLIALLPALGAHPRFWVLQDSTPVLPAGERAYVVAHAERDLKVLWNLVEFAAIFGRERPGLVISSGAGVAIPAAVLARLAGVPVIYIEPCSAVTRLSLTGRLMQHLASAFFVQWPQLLSRARGAKYEGGLL